MLLVGLLLIPVIDLVIDAANFKQLLVMRLHMAGSGFDLFIRIAAAAHLALCQKLRVSAKQNIGTAARHVGGNGDISEFACLCYDLRFLGVIFGVQYLVLNAPSPKHIAQHLGLFDADRTDKYGLAGCMSGYDLVHNSGKLALFSGENAVVEIDPCKGSIRWNLHNIEPIDTDEFVLLGFCGTRHAGKLAVHSKVILIGYCRKGLILVLDLDVLLCLQSLVQALGIPSSYHKTAGELVDDEHLSILNHIVLIPGEQRICTERLLDIMV